ncbi:hypothetical protein CDAR_600811 [Caerostris darwini]|uniref:Uncharacterized protein n=1 Tax=Caerostris darwini TaxID=1538125 RepID=A0AAV4TV68_9ARAC|nr:hypothetical protein CDAR_600811 [Caerostris darwini]
MLEVFPANRVSPCPCKHLALDLFQVPDCSVLQHAHYMSGRGSVGNWQCPSITSWRDYDIHSSLLPSLARATQLRHSGQSASNRHQTVKKQRFGARSFHKCN